MAVASLIMATAVLGGCARSGARPWGAPTVSAGCAVDRVAISWSGIVEKPVLTLVRVQPSTHVEHPDAPAASWRPPAWTTLRDEPVVPAVQGQATPPGWLPALGRSLQTASGKRVHTEKGHPGLGSQLSDGLLTEDGRLPGTVFFAGVQQISAAFTVACSPPVRGTFVAWTVSSFGNVSCDLVNSAPGGPMGQLALGYCPDLVTPPPSR